MNRRWLLILMMALLPWRLWLGDAMAIELAAPAPTHHVTHVSARADTAHPPCHSNAMSPSEAVNSTNGPDTHANCTLCDVCHSAMHATQWRLPLLPAVPQAPPTLWRTAYLSAPLAPDLRPPIL